MRPYTIKGGQKDKLEDATPLIPLSCIHFCYDFDIESKYTKGHLHIKDYKELL